MKNKDVNSIERTAQELKKSGKLSQDDIEDLDVALRKLKHAAAVKDLKSLTKAVGLFSKVLLKVV